jgi:hypothetical protein
VRVLIVTLCLLASMFLISCGKSRPVVQPQIVTIREPVEVRIPIPVKAEPPPELLAAITSPLPVFVAPSDPKASSALTAEGERLLRGLIEDLLTRIRAWEAWAAK